MYLLYSAPLRRHLELRAPMLEGSSENIETIKNTESWKHKPSVIVDADSRKIVETNSIDVES